MTTRYYVLIAFTYPGGAGHKSRVVDVQPGTSRDELFHRMLDLVAADFGGDSHAFAVTFFDAQPDTLGGEGR